MPDGLAEIIGAAVGGGATAGGIVLGLLRLVVGSYVKERKEFEVRVTEDIRSLERQLGELRAAIERKNGAEVQRVRESLDRLWTAHDKDHARLGKVEDEQIAQKARRGEP